MFIPFIGRHCRSLALSFLLRIAGSAAAIAPTAHADSDAGACASLLAFPKPPPVPLSFPKPPPVPLGGISGTVSPSTAAVTVSLYRCAGPDAVRRHRQGTDAGLDALWRVARLPDTSMGHEGSPR